MKDFSPQASTELFHLILLDALGRKLDRRFYAVKGGCNLRFFMRSIRYSEDMDIDLSAEIPRHKLKDILDRITASKPFEQILQARGIRLINVSAPKQTDTTQRWKFALAIPGSSVPIPTKIEFSRRGMEEGAIFEPVDPQLIRTYRLTPMLVSHYSLETAYVQKVKALATRREIEARDLFDLHLLLDAGTRSEVVNKRLSAHLPKARSNAWTITFPIFKAQVWSYLDPECHARYDSAEVWDNMVLRVVQALGGDKP